ncbi:MAG TPA: hypothetical protein VMV19_05605 [Xanthobacteraceae bacterium]|nr:hypothetical protein [Xanthobacteraceae bacterium]
MGGPGVEARMTILRQAAEQQILKPLRDHGWEPSIASEIAGGEYLIIKAQKADKVHTIAFLYTSATANQIYKFLDGQVEHIFINGALYRVESYAHGISKPVSPIDQFFATLIAWNKEIAPAVAAPTVKPKPHAIRRITSEAPLDAIWARLEQFRSVHLARKLVERRHVGEVRPIAMAVKAEGIAFTIRNAADYFRTGNTESLSRRILNLYYGVLALASAEMLASPSGASDLDEIESFTKSGHGLNTVPSSAGGFAGFHVHVLNSGFYARWASFLGSDITTYPKQRAKTDGDLQNLPPDTQTTISRLLSAIPELGDLYLEVFDGEPSWIVLLYDAEASGGFARSSNGARPDSSYVTLLDQSGRISQERIQAANWPITEIALGQSEYSGKAFRARVDHAGHEFWHGALPLHDSAFLPDHTLIMPVLSGAGEYRSLALVVLYALSIIVRYMPSIWRRIEGGDWDQYLAVIKTTIGIFERVLPEEFLETIIGERVHARQPGSRT